MSINDWLTIAAIVLGPLIAVQLTRFLDDRREVRSRKLAIFRTLMATRASNLTVEHINALNSIDLEFRRHRKSEKRVIDAWLLYLDHVLNHSYPREHWNTKRVELLIELLYEMGNCLGYSFDKTHIKNGVYSPIAFGELEDDQAAIRRGLREVLTGRRSLPVKVEKAAAQEMPVLPGLFPQGRNFE